MDPGRLYPEMNRRSFLKFLGLAPFVPLLKWDFRPRYCWRSRYTTAILTPDAPVRIETAAETVARQETLADQIARGFHDTIDREARNALMRGMRLRRPSSS